MIHLLCCPKIINAHCFWRTGLFKAKGKKITSKYYKRIVGLTCEPVILIYLGVIRRNYKLLSKLQLAELEILRSTASFMRWVLLRWCSFERARVGSSSFGFPNQWDKVALQVVEAEYIQEEETVRVGQGRQQVIRSFQINIVFWLLQWKSHFPKPCFISPNPTYHQNETGDTKSHKMTSVHPTNLTSSIEWELRSE